VSAEPVSGGAPAGQPVGGTSSAGSRALADPHPEAKVGKAFAGGLAAAFVLRRLAKRRHRA
jgi:hypothetical protein